MIKFVYGDQLEKFPYLKRTMFLDRAEQFSTRLRWAVSVNLKGEERDEYDELNPLYVIALNPDGLYAGSMRFLPSTSRIMVNDHFSHLTDGMEIRSPLIWECTRFCVSSQSIRSTAPALLAAAGKLMQERMLECFVGVFDHRVERIYSKMDVSPIILGRASPGEERIAVGAWEFCNDTYERLLSRARISREEMDLYYVNSMDLPADMAH